MLLLSQADQIFRQLINEILNHGTDDYEEIVRPKWSDGTPAHTLSIVGIQNKYDLSKEFPAFNLRPTAFKKAVDEIFWVWQRLSNNVKDLNSKVWNQWADEKGSIGLAYGYQLGQMHRYKEGWFNQVQRVLYDLKHNRASRRIMTNIFVHQDLHAMNLYPCAYETQWLVKKGVLHLILGQRSSDVMVANNWNVVQYAVLQHIFAHLCGFEVGTLTHNIGDAHIYDRHIPFAKEMLLREDRPAPLFVMNTDKTDFLDFTIDDFKLENYNPHPQLQFEVAE